MAGGDVLTPESPISDGDTLVSASGSFALGFFSPPGNASHRYVGIWYHMLPIQTIVWVANREKPLAIRSGTLSITRNGTLVIMDTNSTAIVWSATPYVPGLVDPVAQLLDTGNFVTREADDKVDVSIEVKFDRFAWQSFQHPTDTHLPGLKLGWNRRTGSANLTSWASAGDPAQGEYTSFLDLQGYPQITMWKGSTKYYRLGQADGFYIGDRQLAFIISEATSPDEVYITIQPRKASDIIRLTISPTGVAQGFMWVEQNMNWSIFWYQPKDQCDALSPCGPNGVCNLNQLLICNCLPGFRPKNTASWSLQDNSEGCERKTALHCGNAKTTTDGFTTLPDMELPDSESMVVDVSLTLEQCKVRCLNNCSCTAYAIANVSSGIGCLMWTSGLIGLRVHNQVGQDLYVRLAAADLASSSASKHSRKRNIRVIMVSLASTIIVLTFIVILMQRILRRRKGTSNNKNRKEEDDDDIELPIFDLATILAATDKFSNNNMLGEGGFGIIYKGQLAEGQEIAVKRLSKTSLQGIDEFKNEVILIAKLQHRNLVRLLGCCIEGDERLLVYEYMPNKSLDDNLFAKDKAMHLNWEARNNIIDGIARGLLYLHQDSQFKIIHRDLKASNILLDKNMNPKISDFGLARIFYDDIANKTQRIVGTFGYMSPEYIMDGVFSVKSDIYSFGVLVLEIISGQRNRSVFLSEHNYLLGYAWKLWNEGRSLELVDPTLGNDFSTAEAVKCIKVALLCVQEFPKNRPTMSTVVKMLVSENPILPEPTQPGFLTRRGSNSFLLDRAEGTSSSMNYDPSSIILGR